MAKPAEEGEMPKGDLPLLEGENEDIRKEAAELVGEAWLLEPNTNFGGKTPDRIISLGHAHLVRNTLRLIKHIGST